MSTYATKKPPLTPVMRVLGWEFVRCVRFSGVLYLLCALVLPWVLFRVILDTQLEQFNPANYYPAFYGLTVLLGIIFAYQAQQGVRQFLSTRPLTTEFMFCWLLCIPIAAVATTFLLANALVHVVYGVSWPWVRPLLWLIFFVALTKCGYWRLMVGRFWEVFAAIGIGGCAVFCFASVHGAGKLQLNTPLTFAEVILLCAATLIALLIGYRAFEFIRTTCGDKGSEAWFAERYGNADVALIEIAGRAEPRPTIKGRPLAKLTNSKEALDWIAWRQCGFGTLLVTFMTGCLGIAMQFGVVVDYSTLPFQFTTPRELFGTSIVMFVLACFAAGTGLGLLMAQMIRQPGAASQMHMSIFFAVRPVSIAALWRLLGKAMFRYAVLAWLLLAGMLAILPLIVFFNSRTSGQFFVGLQEQNLFYSSLGSFSIAAWLLLGFLVMWTSAGVTASSMFFGNDRATVLIFAVVVCLLVGSVFLGLALSNQRVLIVNVMWIVVGAVTFLTTAFAFRSAIRRNYVTGRHIAGGVLLWTLSTAFAVNFVATQHVMGAVLLSSLSAFAVAAGPLGLSASRHR